MNIGEIFALVWVVILVFLSIYKWIPEGFKRGRKMAKDRKENVNDEKGGGEE